ncbi:unnamed protein product, partial [Amoebophrya sp. A120]
QKARRACGAAPWPGPARWARIQGGPQDSRRAAGWRDEPAELGWEIYRARLACRIVFVHTFTGKTEWNAVPPGVRIRGPRCAKLSNCEATQAPRYVMKAIRDGDDAKRSARCHPPRFLFFIRSTELAGQCGAVHD